VQEGKRNNDIIFLPVLRDSLFFKKLLP